MAEEHDNSWSEALQRLNAERGVQPVTRWKAADRDVSDYDDLGVPRCPQCGAEVAAPTDGGGRMRSRRVRRPPRGSSTRRSQWRGYRRVTMREYPAWLSMYTSFVASPATSLFAWLDQTTDEQWQQAGFRTRPSYQTCYRRFVDLEQLAAFWRGLRSA